MNAIRSAIAAGLIAIVVTAVPVGAATLTVTSNADAGPDTLRQAISDGLAGDKITFAPGIATVDLTSGELSINKSLSIIGPGAKLLTIRRSAAGGTPDFRIFNISAGTISLSGLTISNGKAIEGGGIFNHGGVVTVSSSAISGNSSPSGQGGGISNNCTGCPMTIANSTISGNSSLSGAGGGIASNSASMTTITNSTISGNTALLGGGIWTNSTMSIVNTTVTGNNADFSLGGGGIHTFPIGGATPTSTRNSIFALNTSPSASNKDINGTVNSLGFNIVGGTALQLQLGSLADNGGPTMTHALLSGSIAIEAGNAGTATTDQRGFARPVDSLAIPNAVGGDGSDIGAYEVQADVLPGCNNINRIVTNGNDSGTDSLRDVIVKVCAGSTITFAPVVTAVTLTTGELALGKSLTINGPGANRLSVQRSTAGGTPNFGIFNIPSASVNAAISGLTIANGSAPSFGGGIDNQGGSLVLSGVAISGNSALSGGGIRNQGGTLVITNAIISGNSANIGGAGILNNGAATITNGTLSGNLALTGNGGGIVNTGALDITNSTIAGNSATGSGGGIQSFSGSVSARSTIIALNTAGGAPDINGPLTSEGFNIVGNFSGATVTPPLFSDQLGVTALQLNLGPLQANGGPTQTRALLTGSVAIDKGNASGSATDQRGVLRPIDLVSVTNVTGGDGADIGAFEFGAPDTDADGVPDSLDNCSLVSNASQLDADSDGYGNICDADLNNSGLVTTADFGLLRSVLNQSAGASATAAAADLNGSGTVTTADFAILRARLNTVPGPSGFACAATIPCP